jgi:hypothetical protein
MYCRHAVYVGYIVALRSRGPEKVENSHFGLLSILNLINQVPEPYSVV